MSLRVLAPVTGSAVALTDVPDPVFAEAMVGPGIAVDPGRAAQAQVRAPVTGTVAKLHPHALIVLADGGRGVLVHLGIDTVELDGAGFTLHVSEQDAVTAGDVLVTFSPSSVADGGRSPLTPVVALDAAADALTVAVRPGDQVTAGEELFTWT
ncbi:PTS sugar transporter subunit IIA [Georgenia deserti]|uniref:PTS glucose transporter subunit IIA n=1 Tax=Georgenia deserti TaxID=2093781 RepID=A0ABW4LCM9_9MICO